MSPENILIRPQGAKEGYTVEMIRVSSTWGVFRSPDNKRKWFVVHIPTSLRMGPFGKTKAVKFAETLVEALPSYSTPGENSSKDSKLIGLYRNV